MSDLERRKFLIANQNSIECETLSLFIAKHVAKSNILVASEGVEAQAKIENDPPLVLLVRDDLPKKNALTLTQWILGKKNLSQLCVIILSPLPDTEHFVDEVVLGRVQFLDKFQDENKFSKILVRALNYSSNNVDREYKLRFLAPGEILIREGEKAETVFILRVGSLMASIQRNSEKIDLGKIEAGEFVGEMAYINGEPRSADVIAATDCELIEIPIDELDHMLFQKPAWSKALMKTLSKRVLKGNKTLVSNG